MVKASDCLGTMETHSVFFTGLGSSLTFTSTGDVSTTGGDTDGRATLLSKLDTGTVVPVICDCLGATRTVFGEGFGPRIIIILFPSVVRKLLGSNLEKSKNYVRKSIFHQNSS